MLTGLKIDIPLLFRASPPADGDGDPVMRFIVGPGIPAERGFDDEQDGSW